MTIVLSRGGTNTMPRRYRRKHNGCQSWSEWLHVICESGNLSTSKTNDSTASLHVARNSRIRVHFPLPFGFSGSVIAQALTPAQIGARIQEVNDQRFELRGEFATLVQQYRDASPQERQRVLGGWQKANAAKIHSLDEQQRELRASLTTQSSGKATYATTDREKRIPMGLSKLEQEQWTLRNSLNQSKSDALSMAKRLSPQQGSQVMTAWERQNAPATKKLYNLTEALVAARRSTQKGSFPEQETIFFPQMPNAFPDWDLAAWDEFWLLQHQRREISRIHRKSPGKTRDAAMKQWELKNAVRLRALEAKFIYRRQL